MAEINAEGLGQKTKYIFSSPPTVISVIFIFLFSSIIGMLFTEKIYEGILFGVISIAIPIYISIIFVYLIKKCMNIRYRMKTEIFLSSFLIFLSLILFIAISVFNWFVKLNIEEALLFSLASPIWLRHVYLSSIIETDEKKSIFLTIPYFLLLLIFLGIVMNMPIKNFILFSIFIAVSLTSSHIFLKAVDEPMHRLFGIGGLEFTRWMIEHYKEGTEYGKRRLEELFDHLGEMMRVEGKTISFWKKNGELYGVMNVNTAHPGPIGEVGGGNMPQKISRFIGCNNFIMPHGASIHDLNPVTTNEVKKLADKIASSLNGENVRVSKSIKVEGDVEVLAQRFGDYLLIAETSSKYGAEDIDPSVAFLLEEKIKNEGYGGLIFIDSHNNLPDKRDETLIYSLKYQSIEDSVLKAASLLKQASLFTPSVGIGKYKDIGIDEGVGPMGIISLVIDVGNQKTAYTVIDGNNMVKGVRNKIIEKLSEFVDNVEVMTTDNHYVNRTYGGSNPLGKKGDNNLIEGCIESVRNAIGDMQECDIKLSRFLTEIKVMGAGKPTQLLSVSEPHFHNLRGIAFLSILSMVSLDVILSLFL
ncbi:MAG: DUF2070 family protein [Thermoplasmata archaeon]|nr:DUF2070 family protein [Thermoplasmata archaeon]